MMLNKQKIAKAVNAVSVCVLAFFGLVLLYFGARVFVCDKYPVSTTSMTPTIIPGDQILVNKLVFGARIYKNLKFLQGDSLETFRIPGFRKIRHNDVVVFNFPFGNDDWQKIEFRINRVFAKRCLGLPGDTLSVVNGFYRNSACRDTLGYYDNEAAFSATPDSLIDPVILRSAPFDEKYDWTTKNFGRCIFLGRGIASGWMPGIMCCTGWRSDTRRGSALKCATAFCISAIPRR